MNHEKDNEANMIQNKNYKNTQKLKLTLDNEKNISFLLIECCRCFLII